MMKNSHRFAFTMVEILAVTALISILAAIGFGSYSYAMGRAKESATRALVKQIEAGVAAFHAKYGYYPPAASYGMITVTRDSSNVVQTIQFGSGYTIGATTGSGKQLQLKKAELAAFMKAVEPETIMKYLDGSGRITDAYGGLIYYRAPGAINTTSFDLIAPGEDGGFGSGKVAAPPETPVVTGESGRTYIDKDNDWICDDIANF